MELLTKSEIESKAKRFANEADLARDQERKWNLKIATSTQRSVVIKAIEMRAKWAKKKEKAKLQRDRFQLLLRQLNEKQ